MAKQQFLIRIEQKLLQRLKKVAEEEGRSVSDLVREALADLLKKRETKPKSKKRGK